MAIKIVNREALSESVLMKVKTISKKIPEKKIFSLG